MDYLDLGLSRASVWALAIVGLVAVLKWVAAEVTELVVEVIELVLVIKTQVRRIRGE